MRVLVSGASGMLGRATVDALERRGHQVRTFQRRSTGRPDEVLGSVESSADVDRAVEGIEGVVHLAAKVSVSGPEEEYRRINIAGTRRVLEAARRAGATRWVQVSSPSVAHAGSSIVGEAAVPADPERARGPYARTKAAAERFALAADAPGFAVVAVRPHLVWGPGDTQLTERILDRARRGRLPLLDGGRALIDSTYVDNGASALAAALERADHAHGRAVVVTNGEPRTIADLLAGICRAGGVPPARFSVPASLARAAGAVVEGVWAIRPGADEPPMTRFLAEQLSTAHWFDQRETRALLEWAPEVSLDEGLRRLAAHYGGEGPQ